MVLVGIPGLTSPTPPLSSSQIHQHAPHPATTRPRGAPWQQETSVQTTQQWRRQQQQRPRWQWVPFVAQKKSHPRLLHQRPSGNPRPIPSQHGTDPVAPHYPVVLGPLLRSRLPPGVRGWRDGFPLRGQIHGIPFLIHSLFSLFSLSLHCSLSLSLPLSLHCSPLSSG